MSLFLQGKSKGAAVVAGLLATLPAVLAPTHASAGEKVLHHFLGGSDGYMPEGSLIADSTGTMFGSTAGGGGGTGCYGGKGCGTVFEVTPTGEERVLYSFQGGSDGISPTGALLMDQSHNLYGTTEGGGSCSLWTYGCGTIFELAPDGTEAVLYAFQGGNDGWYPEGNLVADAEGNLFGVANTGGNYNGTACENEGCGTVFELEPNKSEITLHTFQGGSDGGVPMAGLIMDSSGNLYGTTFAGGGCSGDVDGCGTVFKVTAGGTETVLYAFQGNSDGMFPAAGLIADSAGNLYGTTAFGGAGAQGCGCGTVFKVSSSGAESILYSFNYGNDGGYPEAALVMDKKGNLYGTTYAGGGTGCRKNGVFTGCGTVFELKHGGTESVLYAFKHTQGQNPAAGLLIRKHDTLYGTATAGGKSNDGVVFELKK